MDQCFDQGILNNQFMNIINVGFLKIRVSVFLIWDFVGSLSQHHG